MEYKRHALIYQKDSKTHGLGVYARKFIPKGTPVIQMGGIIMGREHIFEDTRALQIGPETYLVEDPENPGLDDLINHSCEPNLAFLDGSLMLCTIRDIQEEDEVFFDYSTSLNESGWSIPCGCGAPGCRGKIMSYCDLPEHEQERLREHTLEYLRTAATAATVSVGD